MGESVPVGRQEPGSVHNQTAVAISPTFGIDLLAKDNRLALAMAEATGLHLELASTPRLG